MQRSGSGRSTRSAVGPGPGSTEPIRFGAPQRVRQCLGPAEQAWTDMAEVSGATLVKVVLFCGGQGLRLRDHSEQLPKPMVTVGYRPMLWHVMRYYAHFGHTEFILCLGYKSDFIKSYFLNYEEALSNDFVVLGGSGKVELLQRDISDWRITFVQTGLNANVGQRLRAVQKYVGDEPFLANYGDVLTDAPLNRRIDTFLTKDAVASFMTVRPTSYSFHVIRMNGGNLVTGIEDVGKSRLWINGGYFIFRPEIFDYIRPGEELIEEPFSRLIKARLLHADPYEGYWAPMDTLKDVQALQRAYDSGKPPWAVWQRFEAA
jgi:glucose-1-phosphate cytidylyltransferase